MDDPLSIATSVVSLLSLGLQSTEYLYEYYTSCQDRHQDLARTAGQLGNLLHSLQIIDEIVRTRQWRPDERADVQNIERSIACCDDAINELQDEVKKFKSHPVNSFSNAVRGIGRRTAYPFRASTLQKLDEDIADFYSNLSTALQALQLGEHHHFQNQEEAVLSPVGLHEGQEPAGRYGHRYGDISIDGDARVHIGDTLIQNDTKEVEELVKAARAQELAANVRLWLRAPDATIDYNNAHNKCHVGTGQWLTQGPSFTTWLQRDNSFLWLYGFAGCGKSVLCSTVIQHAFRYARSQTERAVAFFFFTFNDESKQDASAVLRALLLQLCGQVPDLETDLTRLKESYNHGTPPVPILLEHLRQAVSRCRHVYILLDALDESPADKSRAEVLLVIETIRQWQLSGLHLLVTSRDIPDIRDHLQSTTFTHGEECIALKNDRIQQDISRYVSFQVDHDPRLQRWGDHREKIKSYLIQHAGGV